MPEAPAPEAALIEEAYEDRVKAIFDQFFTNLSGRTPGPQNDKQCLAMFTTGIKLAKHAGDLALGALATA
jgi:hypothetical protein